MSQQNVVIRNISRPTALQLEKLKSFGVATVHEAQGRTGLLAPYIRPIYPGARAVGSALTVLAHPGDNTMLHVAAAECQPGDIIVVALSADNSDGMLGELLATSFRAHGGVGVVLDAGCRDIAILKEMEFPVWSKGISARGTVKATLGSVNVPVVCAGAYIHPGDAIVADEDGVVVVRRESLDQVIDLATQREAKEAKVRDRLAAGELGLDLYGMREKLAQLGLVYQDMPMAEEKGEA
jgi:4-hydroxy-4-methyl-2-oxoglutarate aldolase